MIFYFSGTGNTRWAAEKLAQATGERLVAIADERHGSCRYALQPGERLGFCFPVHGWQPPAIVRAFIRRATFSGAASAFVYAVCTCGDSCGEAMTILARELAARGLRLNNAYSLIMPESYVCLPFMYTDKPEKEWAKKRQAAQDLEHFVRDIVQRQPAEWQLERGATPRLYSYVIGAYFNRHMITDRPFRVDASRCISCGRCAEACPAGDLVGGKGEQPRWRHDGSCTCCLACYHHCPVHAIDYGRRTRTRGQYYFSASD